LSFLTFVSLPFFFFLTAFRAGVLGEGDVRTQFGPVVASIVADAQVLCFVLCASP
jgi:hypothetical protein